jgi:hypothetical protein
MDSDVEYVSSKQKRDLKTYIPFKNIKTGSELFELFSGNPQRFNSS